MFVQRDLQCYIRYIRLRQIRIVLLWKRFPSCLQELGWYDPLRKETNLNAPAIKKWLSVGAQPSETVEKLLKKAMIMDP